MTIEEQAIALFELYTSLTYDPSNSKHKVLVTNIGQFMSNTSENTGLNSISLNGITESYMSNLPDYILKGLDKLAKKVKFL